MRKKRWTAAVAAVLCVLTLAGCKGKPLPDGMEEDAVLAAGEEIVQQLTGITPPYWRSSGRTSGRV